MSGHRNHDVRLLRWPQHSDERDWCHANRVPRILLVEPGHTPPALADVYEDWIRPPVPPADLQIRVHALQARRRLYNRPQVDPHGGLVFQGQRLAISPTQVDLTTCLVRSYGELVLRATLADCLPGGCGTTDRRNVLDLHMGRLRKKLAPLGLSIRTVWGCGYVLECEDAALVLSREERAAG